MLLSLLGDREEWLARQQEAAAGPDQPPPGEQHQHLGDHHQVHAERQLAWRVERERKEGQLKDIQGMEKKFCCRGRMYDEGTFSPQRWRTSRTTPAPTQSLLAWSWSTRGQSRQFKASPSTERHSVAGPAAAAAAVAAAAAAAAAVAAPTPGTSIS